ncbi:MAG: sodium ion-translocating decarboxylase subunit beta, partial [Alistipes sp.]|nr:sodium ion-translocating decarboxylase subunit beta [Alistipes sp.]
MKSVKFYFSLLLSAVMLSVAMPAMAQDEPAEAQAEIEAIAETAEAEAIAVVDEGAEAAVAAAVQGTQGRDNSSIDEEFSVGNAISNFVDQAGFNGFLKGDNWKCAVMLLISFLLLYLAIVKQFEPLLLMPIAFGMLLTNLPGAGMFHSEFFAGGHVHWGDFALGSAGLLDYLYLGVKLGI